MNHPHEIRPDLDQGIDRKVLATLRARFLHLNQARLQRAMEGLSTRQQQVLLLLPLLFHVNHPLLPGYVSAAPPQASRATSPVASWSQKPSAWPAHSPTRPSTATRHGRYTACS